MPAPQPLDVADASLVEDYLAAMRAAGRKTGRSTTRAANTCQAKIRRSGGWGGLTAEQQLDAVAKAPSFTSWLMVTGRITVDAELLSRSDLRPGLPARLFCAALPLVQRNMFADRHSQQGYRGAVEHPGKDHRDDRRVTARCHR